jgi:hypothetical protein
VTTRAETTPEAGRGRSAALSYALGHRLRIEILVLLNEHARSTSELARKLREPLSKVTHHVNELQRDGSIELAETRTQRNTLEHVFRAMRPSENSEAEWLAKPVSERQIEAALILQNALAEHLAAYDAGVITEDEHVGLLWRWFNVDQEGRVEIVREQEASWKRLEKIEARSAARRLESGESNANHRGLLPRSPSSPAQPGAAGVRVSSRRRPVMHQV